MFTESNGIEDSVKLSISPNTGGNKLGLALKSPDDKSATKGANLNEGGTPTVSEPAKPVEDNSKNTKKEVSDPSVVEVEGQSVKLDDQGNPVAVDEGGEGGGSLDDSGEGQDDPLAEERAILSGLSTIIKEDLGLDVEVSEDMDAGGFVRSLKQTIIDQDLLNPESESYAGVIKRALEQEGLTEQDLISYRDQNLGFDREAYNGLREIVDFSRSEFSKEDEQAAKTLFFYKHKITGVSDEDAERYANRDFSDPNFDELIKSAKGEVAAVYGKEVSRMDTLRDQAQNARLEQSRKKSLEVDTLLRSRRIMGKEYTPDEIETYLKMVSKKTETYTTPSGQEIKVSPYRKKQLSRTVEEELAESIEFALGSVTAEEKAKQNLKIEKKKQVGRLTSIMNKSTEGERARFEVGKVERLDSNPAQKLGLKK